MLNNTVLGSLGPDDKKKLEAFLFAGVRQLQDIDDIKGSLRDTAKNLAEEFGVKPKHLMTAARIAYRNDLGQKKQDMSTVEDILNVTGHG